jgi:hypothetical protein
MDYNSAQFPGNSLLIDNCNVYGSPATYWVGSSSLTSGHTITLTLPCTVTIDRKEIW